MNYILIVIADILFSLQFLMTGAYSRRTNGGIAVSLAFSTGTSAIIAAYMFVVRAFTEGFGLAVNWYSLILSVAMTAVGMLSGYFSIKSLEYINISLYSVFLMLGGMIVPSVFGVIIGGDLLKIVEGEYVTYGKIVCILLIIVAMMLSIDKSASGKKGAAKYYLACFFLNGCCGVIAKALTIYEKYEVSTNDFLITYMTISALGAFTILVFLTKGKPMQLFSDIKNIACMAGYSVFHGIAEFCSLFTIANGMDVSVQQPLVSGGVLIASFAISVIMREKQTWRTVLSTVVAVFAVLAISFINTRVF